MEQSIIDKIAEINEEAKFYIGLDKAIIGISESLCVVYDIDIIKQILYKNGMPLDQIEEYIDYNILNVHLGEYTPIIIYKL
jgi:hypothetical protein